MLVHFHHHPGSVTRSIGAISCVKINMKPLIPFKVLMTSKNCLSIFDYRLTLSHRTHTFDAINLIANILTAILSATLLILIRTTPITTNKQYFCGRKPIIVMDECNDEPKLCLCDSLVNNPQL